MWIAKNLGRLWSFRLDSKTSGNKIKSFLFVSKNYWLMDPLPLDPLSTGPNFYFTSDNWSSKWYGQGLNGLYRAMSYCHVHTHIHVRTHGCLCPCPCLLLCPCPCLRTCICACLSLWMCTDMDTDTNIWTLIYKTTRPWNVVHVLMHEVREHVVHVNRYDHIQTMWTRTGTYTWPRLCTCIPWTWPRKPDMMEPGCRKSLVWHCSFYRFSIRLVRHRIPLS